MNDKEALDKIAEVLTGEWNADAVDKIARIVGETGRDFCEADQGEEG